MEDNNTECLCEFCNSPIIAYVEDGFTVFECIYCGNSPGSDGAWSSNE